MNDNRRNHYIGDEGQMMQQIQPMQPIQPIQDYGQDAAANTWQNLYMNTVNGIGDEQMRLETEQNVLVPNSPKVMSLAGSDNSSVQ